MTVLKSNLVSEIRNRVAEVVVGQDVVVERILIALLTGGHLLLEGVPGLAKTLLVNTVARTIGMKFGRVQFTIDMLPSDVIGSEILDQSTHEFRIHKGPVFTNLLLADEINRAAPKVQGCLLESMQERKVTLGNKTFPLPAPFLVIATQNPIEQAGTFELPEAQLDRFMLCHRLHYPSADEEKDIYRRQLNMGLSRPKEGGAVPRSAFDMIADGPVCGIDDLVEMMEQVQTVHVSETFTEHVVRMVRRTREHNALEVGCSPRAGLSLVQAARARAFLHDRDFVTPEDLFSLAEDIVLHRIRLTYEAVARGLSLRDVLEEIMREV
ncbi:AAA family ATPase [Lignipirellula cremea]|uniref:ATPase family associated with various cellular activities (AAA) n=1 Tax=Lignipirellula cremea TaxID=2528010 RepID=A0A518DLZ8_9BACT|nr:MoxR family ATPase [Lignipirellula cremea]QDU92855.1 ATPase family associated with various cellular activities (AAA) [Lignipirellula cremea]